MSIFLYYCIQIFMKQLYTLLCLYKYILFRNLNIYNIFNYTNASGGVVQDTTAIIYVAITHKMCQPGAG